MTAPRPRSALSLIEVVIAIAIFGMLMSLVGQSLVMGVKLKDSVGTATTLDDEANRVLQKIAGYLRTADYNYIYILNPTNGNVTCTFSLCTGLNRHGPIVNQKKLRVSYDKAARSLTSTLYDTSASATNESLWTSLEQVVASNLAAENGFVVTQQGTDSTYVKGNRLTLTVSLAETLRDGTEVAKSATTTLYLRSTIYFKDEQLSSATDTTTISPTPSPGGGGGPATGGTTTTTTTDDVSTTATSSDSAANAPVISLGPDTDNSVHAGSGGSNVIITISSSLKSTAASGTSLQSLTVTATCPNANTLTVTRIASNQYRITGYAVGAITVGATATSKKGSTTYTSTTSRIY
jgi:prepilin-type N-terminal cleavage/methylation domain-containing protein